MGTISIDQKKLDSYIEHVLQESHKFENRPLREGILYTYIIENGVIHYKIKTPFDRVTRRSVRRLNNGFRYKFNLIPDIGINNDENHKFLDLYSKKETNVLDINFVCNKFDSSMGFLYLKDMENEYVKKKGNVVESYRCEKLVQAFYNIDEDEYRKRIERYRYLLQQCGNQNEALKIPCHLPHDMKWGDYREIFRKAFGKYPEIQIECTSKDIKPLYE